MQTEIAPNSSQKMYRARGAAMKLWGCRDEEILMDGPAGTGKTRAICEKIHFCAMKYPGMRYLLCRKTRESMTESVLVTLEEQVIAAEDPILLGPRRNLRQSYRYANGSVGVIGGLDKPTKIMSTEYDMVAIFEATECSEEDHESLTTRLRNGVMPYQQIILDCNPSNPNHWLNKRASTDKMTRLLSRHEDNPRWFDGKNYTEPGKKYLAKLDALSGVRKLRLRNGIWAAAEGLVYEEFDPQIHVVPWFAPPPDWRRIRVIDFGFTNPFVCQWWAISPDGDMYLYREIYTTRTLVEDHATRITELSGYERFEATISDHDAEDRATLERYGIWTIPAYKSVRPGIEGVQARLRPTNKGKPRLFVMKGARVDKDGDLVEAALPTCTEEEFEGYVYPKGVDGKPIKEDPVKKDDHGMDATRYGVAYVDNLAGMRVQVQAENAVVVN